MTPVVGIDRARADGADDAVPTPVDLPASPRLVPPAEKDPAVVVAPASATHVLAAELHDGVSQQLFAAELDVHELRCMPGLAPDVRHVLDRLALRLETGSRELRSALFKMLEAEREQEELTPLPGRVRETLADFRERHDLTVILRVHGDGPDPLPAASRLLLRTVREGLANVVKHAGATQVLVVLRCGRRWWTAEVHDDGSGDPRAVRECAAGATSFGLYSLVSDTSRVGGRLWLTESPSLCGVRLSVSVPVVGRADATGRHEA